MPVTVDRANGPKDHFERARGTHLPSKERNHCSERLWVTHNVFIEVANQCWNQASELTN